MSWTTLVGIALAPLGTVCIIWLASVIKLYIIRNMKNGWLKDNLLRERWNSSASDSHRRITGGQERFR